MGVDELQRTRPTVIATAGGEGLKFGTITSKGPAMFFTS